MIDIRKVTKIEEVNINLDYLNLNNKKDNSTYNKSYYGDFKKELEQAKKDILIRKRKKENSNLKCTLFRRH